MAMNVPPGPVRDRLAIVMPIELELDEALMDVARALGQTDGMAEVNRIRTLVQEHAAALAALGLGSGDRPRDLPVAAADGALTEAVMSAERGLSAATRAYAALHLTARVLYEPDVCDLAERHLADHIDGLRVMARLLPAAVAAELNAGGLFCRCICPSCSIGACLCVRSSLTAVADAWGWPGLKAGDGVELRSPPRPGSQLAAADVHERDRVLSVDGEIIRSNGELQAALRKHLPGEMAHLSIQRSTGELIEVPITR